MSCNRRPSYGLSDLVFDILLTVITGGLWLVWIFYQEMRR